MRGDAGPGCTPGAAPPQGHPCFQRDPQGCVAAGFVSHRPLSDPITAPGAPQIPQSIPGHCPSPPDSAQPGVPGVSASLCPHLGELVPLKTERKIRGGSANHALNRGFDPPGAPSGVTVG